MPLLESKVIRVTMIPWIMAIVALIGLNSLVSFQRFAKKHEAPHDSAISELSDEIQARDRVTDPQVYAEPVETTETVIIGPCVRIPRISPLQQPLVSSFTAGAVRGRAPPFTATI